MLGHPRSRHPRRLVFGANFFWGELNVQTFQSSKKRTRKRSGVRARKRHTRKDRRRPSQTITQRHEITFELWLHKTTLLPPPMRRLPQHSTYGKVRPFDGLISGIGFETGSSSSIKHGLGGDLVSSGLAFDVLLPATVGGRRIVPKAL